MGSQPRYAAESRAVVLGTRIRLARRDKGLSQRQLAAGLPLSQGHVSRIEAGEHAPPANDILIRIAKALDLEPQSQGLSPADGPRRR